MEKLQLPIGLYCALSGANSNFIPKKPRFSFASTKAKLANYFQRNKDFRETSEENKANFPRMHQSVQDTAWTLLMYYMKNWGKSTAKDYEIRITYSYLQKALNESCCVATLKNHINKLLGMYDAFFTFKFRGGLGLPGQNTACFILKIRPELLQFEDPRHNEAILSGQQVHHEATAAQLAATQQARAGAAAITGRMAELDREARKRMSTPPTIADLIPTDPAAMQKRILEALNGLPFFSNS